MKALDGVLRVALILLAIIMVLTVSWQVISRYGLRSPSSVTEELARFQLIWLGLLGSVYTFRNRMHVGIDILVGNLTGRRRLVAELASLAACLVFAATVLVYGGGQLVALTHELNQTSAALGVRMSYVYAILPTSGILMCLYAIQYILDGVLRGVVHKPTGADQNFDDLASQETR